jgi:hypothetical protein
MQSNAAEEIEINYWPGETARKVATDFGDDEVYVGRPRRPESELAKQTHA